MSFFSCCSTRLFHPACHAISFLQVSSLHGNKELGSSTSQQGSKPTACERASVNKVGIFPVLFLASLPCTCASNSIFSCHGGGSLCFPHYGTMVVMAAGGHSESRVLTGIRTADHRPQISKIRLAALNFCSVHQPAGPSTAASKDSTKKWCFQLKMPTGL